MQANSFQFLDLSRLAASSPNVQAFLSRVVRLIGLQLEAPVCEIYLIKKAQQQEELAPPSLTLKAGDGALTDEETHSARLAAEMSLRNKHAVSLLLGRQFVSVPIIRYQKALGVLLLSRDAQQRPFSEKEIATLRQISGQLSAEIENISLLIKLHEDDHEGEAVAAAVELPKRRRSAVLRGKGICPGVAVGKSLPLEKALTLADFSEKKAAFSKPYTRSQFEKAIQKTQQQIKVLQKELAKNLDAWANNIFVGHLLILQDQEYIGKMRALIDGGSNPPQAILALTKQFITLFLKSKSPSLREKAKDLEDLGLRLLKNLLSETERYADYYNKIIITKEILPSEILQLVQQGVKGIILTSQISSVTSHAVLIARSLGLAFVVLEEKLAERLPAEETVLLDGTSGEVLLAPPAKRIKAILRRDREEKNYTQAAQKTTLTADGTAVTVLANVNVEKQIKLANQFQAEGIGLYRTEFPFMVRSGFPSEEEQYFLYQRIVKKNKQKELIIRTLDLGGDKLLPYHPTGHREPNPSLGLRSIRFSLKHREIFIPQLKAILRASAQQKVKLLLPMISSLEEVRQSKAVVEQCKRQLREEKCAFNEALPLGIMIEVPSAIWILESLAREVDFFCIGTNDLTQYLLAADRNNYLVSEHFDELHPAILRTLAQLVRGCNALGKEVTLCGLMAEVDEFLAFLLGIGLRRLSLSPEKIPKLKKRLAKIALPEAEALAERALRCDTRAELQRVLRVEA